MINLLFFASLREQLGRENISMEFNADLKTVADVVSAACLQLPALSTLTANRSRLMVAVNQDMVSWSTPVKDGDEVALLPPVTGG